MSLKIIAFGEALFDLFHKDENPDNIGIEAFGGGAPMNFICACSKFGAKPCLFYTNLTDSSYSQKLKNILSKFDVKIRTQRNPGEPPTAMVMDNGEFTFHVTPDSLKFSKWAFKRRDFWGADVFHFGTLYLATKEGFKATLKAARRAKRKGIVVTCDINYRQSILDTLNVKERIFRKRIMKLLRYMDVVKFNESEALKLAGTTRTQKLFKVFSNRKNRNRLYVMTRGIKGADVFYRGQVYSHAAYKADKVVDETGAGDIFFAGFIVKLLSNSKRNFNMETIRTAMEFANKMAARSVAYKGAITPLEMMDTN